MTPDGTRLLARACAALSLIALVPGCVAVPVIAAGAIMAKRESGTVRAATPVPAEPAAAIASGRPAIEQYAAGPRVAELPPPDAPSQDWAPLVRYALEHRNTLGGSAPNQSAILAPGAPLDVPRRRPCAASTPAVIVDLDEGRSTFSAKQAAAPAPGLADALSRMRSAGITVLWISDAEAGQVSEVANALRSSGLDPAGEDQVLLVRHGEDRKQVLREQANDDVCVLAIAGDEESDFDELFDYLRDPDRGDFLLSLLSENGWFFVPPPFQSTPGQRE